MKNITITSKMNTRNQSYNGKWYAEAVETIKGRKYFIVSGNGDTQKQAIAHVQYQLKAMGK